MQIPPVALAVELLNADGKIAYEERVVKIPV
jgi:hypothetical protein